MSTRSSDTAPVRTKLVVSALAIGCWVSLLAQPGSAAEYIVVPVALPGDVAPGPDGGTLAPVRQNPCVTTSGEVYFAADVKHGAGLPRTGGIFRASGTTLEAVVQTGDPAPGGGVFVGTVGFEGVNQNLSCNDSGHIAFRELVTEDPADAGSTARVGIFVLSDEGISLIARSQDPAPGGEDLFGNLIDPSINGAGEVAFVAAPSFSPGVSPGGLYSDADGALTALALLGEPIPGQDGVYGPIIRPDISDSGTVAFQTSWRVAGVRVSGNLVHSDGMVEAAALSTDPMPETGAPYQALSGPRSNDAGDVTFSGGRAEFAAAGVFVDSGGSDTIVAAVGDSTPGDEGDTFRYFFGDPDINDAGEVAFFARSMLDEDDMSAGLPGAVFVRSSGGTVRLPDAFGHSGANDGFVPRSWTSPPPRPWINEIGDVAFMANNFPEDSTGFDCGRARLHCGIFLGLRLPEVEIRIGSRAHARSIGWRRRRLIRVAILGSDTFEVSAVNVGSLAFGPNGASPWHYGRGGRPWARRLDVNGDGLLDLVSYYRLRETGLTRHDRDACLVGKLNDAWSRPFEACDQLARPIPRYPHRR